MKNRLFGQEPDDGQKEVEFKIHTPFGNPDENLELKEKLQDTPKYKYYALAAKRGTFDRLGEHELNALNSFNMKCALAEILPMNAKVFDAYAFSMGLAVLATQFDNKLPLGAFSTMLRANYDDFKDCYYNLRFLYEFGLFAQVDIDRALIVLDLSWIDDIGARETFDARLQRSDDEGVLEKLRTSADERLSELKAMDTHATNLGKRGPYAVITSTITGGKLDDE